MDQIEEVFKELQAICHAAARGKGFWKHKREGSEVMDALVATEKIALMHSELAEALEGLRDSNPASEKIPEFSQVEEELADTIIRVLDYAGSENFNIGAAIVAKLKHNQGREELHGRAF